MPEKATEVVSNLAQLITWGWVAFMSLLGGLVSYYQRVDRRKIKHSAVRMFGEIAASAFVGLVTFELCDYSGIDFRLAAVFCGVSSYQGTKALIKLSEIRNAIRRSL